MVVRPKIQVDASPELIAILKQAADAQESKSFKMFILLSIAEAHPELKKAIYKELGLTRFLEAHPELKKDIYKELGLTQFP